MWLYEGELRYRSSSKLGNFMVKKNQNLNDEHIFNFKSIKEVLHP